MALALLSVLVLLAGPVAGLDSHGDEFAWTAEADPVPATSGPDGVVQRPDALDAADPMALPDLSAFVMPAQALRADDDIGIQLPPVELAIGGLEPSQGPSQRRAAESDSPERDAGEDDSLFGLPPSTRVTLPGVPFATDVLGPLPLPALDLDLLGVAPRTTDGPDRAALVPRSGVMVVTPPTASSDTGSVVVATALVAGIALQAAPAFTSARRPRAFPLLPMYARIPRDRLLEHPVRAAVYDELQAAPGLTIEQLAQRTGHSRSTVRHHIHSLADAGMVRFDALGRERIHYPAGHRETAVRDRLLADPNRAALMDRLGTGPATLTELATAIEASPSKTHFHLRRLTSAGLVTKGDKPGVYVADGSMA